MDGLQNVKANLVLLLLLLQQDFGQHQHSSNDVELLVPGWQPAGGEHAP
jgi:hypothetical protein